MIFTQCKGKEKVVFVLVKFKNSKNYLIIKIEKTNRNKWANLRASERYESAVTDLYWIFRDRLAGSWSMLEWARPCLPSDAAGCKTAQLQDWNVAIAGKYEARICSIAFRLQLLIHIQNVDCFCCAGLEIQKLYVLEGHGNQCWTWLIHHLMTSTSTQRAALIGLCCLFCKGLEICL